MTFRDKARAALKAPSPFFFFTLFLVGAAAAVAVIQILEIISLAVMRGLA